MRNTTASAPNISTAHGRLNKLREWRHSRDFTMWSGMIAREFADGELAYLAREGMLSEEDGWALEAVGRLNPLHPRPARGFK